MPSERSVVNVAPRQPPIAAPVTAQRRRRNFVEFVKFCAVGGSGVGVNLGIYALLTRVFVLAPALASPIAIEISLLTNFLLNER